MNPCNLSPISSEYIYIKKEELTISFTTLVSYCTVYVHILPISKLVSWKRGGLFLINLVEGREGEKFFEEWEIFRKENEEVAKLCGNFPFSSPSIIQIGQNWKIFEILRNQGSNREEFHLA